MVRRRPKYAVYYLCDAAAAKILRAVPRASLRGHKPGQTLWLVRSDRTDPVPDLPPTGVSRFVTVNRGAPVLASTDHPLFGPRVGAAWDLSAARHTLKLKQTGDDLED